MTMAGNVNRRDDEGDERETPMEPSRCKTCGRYTIPPGVAPEGDRCSYCRQAQTQSTLYIMDLPS
jgi:hypothetical protein